MKTRKLLTITSAIADRLLSAMNHKIAIAIAIAILAASSAQAAFTYTSGNLNSAQTYDGLGVDSGLNPDTIPSSGNGDDYIGTGGTGSLTVLSGSLTIKADDFKVGVSGGNGALYLGTNAALSIQNIGSWGAGLGQNGSSVGTLVVSNNASLTYNVGANNEQRLTWGINGGTVTVTVLGGSINVTNGTGASDDQRSFNIGAQNGHGTVNLVAGTITDTMPLSFGLGGQYSGMNSTPTWSASTTTSSIIISNGSFVMTSLCPSTDAGKATFKVGASSYVVFYSGTGSLSLTNWASSDYAGLVTNGLIRIGAPGITPIVTNMSVFSYSSVGGQGVLTVNPFTLPLTVGIPTASVANPVLQGTTTTLSAAVAGGTSPYAYQWQTDGGSGGTLTNIPGATSATYSVNTTGMALGAYSYSLVVTDSVLATASSATPAVVGVYKVISGALASTANVQPTPGVADLTQFTDAGWGNSDGLNYYTDWGQGNDTYCGQTFTTGSNSNGYTLNSLAIKLSDGSQSQVPGTTYDLFIYEISTNGLACTLIADVTNLMASTFAYPDWAQWNFSGVTLNSNTVYGYGFGRRSGVSGWIGIACGPNWYYAFPGGQMAAFPREGGAVRYGNSGYGDQSHDAVFDIGLIPNTPGIILNTPTVSPNPAYALSPVQLRDTVLAGVPISYQWLTGNGSGGYIQVSGATSTNLTVYPPDLNPGGADYVTNYYMVATDASANSVTSSAIALTIHAATVPLITGPTPANVVTFVGDSRSYTVTENGTLPILTNQWQFNNGGGYVSLTGQTNTTLALSNLQTTDSGSYQIVASNVVGSASNSVTLTVNPAPAAPVASNQMYYNAVYTNHPWAYWRLNETNDPTAPGAPIYTAYDYSGHGFDAVYGNQVTVGNPMSSVPPYLTFPGMDANELAVDTLSATTNAWLTPPALNLAGNSNVTFMTWIYPAGTVAKYTGLLMNRGGPDNGCGFGFTTTADHLGYTWNNNSSSTYNWDSGLAVAENQWNFVAYVITPTNAVLYLGNLVGGTNFSVSTHTLSHISQTFAGGTVRLGGDSSGVNNTFNGLITEASLFTNALTTVQVQQYFLIAAGVQGLAPAITTDISCNALTNQYVGQAPLQLTVVGVGSPTPNYQWQAGTGGVFTNLVNGGAISGANSGTLTINPATTANNMDYKLVLTNMVGSATSSVYTVSLVAGPTNGLWTACFQTTNSGVSWWGNYGSGSYTGSGVLGSGSFWNPVPGGGNYAGGTWTSASGYKDDGSTPSGITCMMTGQSLANAAVPFASTNRAGLLSQMLFVGAYTTNAIVFTNVPNGNYNLAFHAACGNWGDRGATFTVHGANGDQTAGTTNNSNYTYFQQTGTTVIFTNVTVTNDVLDVDVAPTSPTPAHNPNPEAYYNAAEIQLVSYGLPTVAFSGTPTIGAAPLAVVFTNTTIGSVTNSAWSFGDGNTAAIASTANVTNTYATAGTYTVSLVVAGLGGVGTLTNTAYIVVTNAAPPVSSDASLSSLALSPLGALTPTFNTTLTNYTATNVNANTSVTVTVTNTSAFATNVLFLNGIAQATNAGSLVASVPLVVGSGNVIQVVVTAQDGVTTSTNTVDVTRLASSNALLSNLVITPAGTLYPTPFSSGTTSYNATNAYANNPIQVTATSADGTAALALSFNNGGSIPLTSAVPSGNQTLVLPMNTVAVQVVSQDLSQTNTYTVNVLLQPSQTVPKLTNSVSGNNLVLSWPADHLGYHLLVQTNNLLKGVSGNINDWGVVAGSDLITSTNITIIKATNNAYYRLVYP
jgi:PKD repeat protein